METESIIARLNKLIAHEKSARSIGSTEEAEVFAAKIQDLMFKYKLEMTDVEFAAQEINEPVEAEVVEEAALTGETRKLIKTGWIGVLTEAVTRANFCRAVGQRGGNGITLIGKASDRAAAKAMMQYLYDACVEAAPIHTQKHCFGGSGDKRSFTLAFKMGFACAIAARLKAQKAQLAAGAGEQGLIRIDQLERQVTAKMKETFPSLRKERASMPASHSGFQTGKAYGAAIGVIPTKRLRA